MHQERVASESMSLFLKVYTTLRITKGPPMVRFEPIYIYNGSLMVIYHGMKYEVKKSPTKQIQVINRILKGGDSPNFP